MSVGIRRIATLVALLSVALVSPTGYPDAAGNAAAKRDVSVYIGKTARRVNVFGWIVPTASGRRVTVKVWKETTDGRRLVARKRIIATRNEQPPYGTTEGTYYSAWLRRPASGGCVATVRVRRGPNGSSAFPCTTPNFGSGTALLVGDDTRTIDALIADENDEHGYGLMYRRKLAVDKGMAFLFSSDSSGGFWMKNTLIPLSIAFVDSGDVVVAIRDMDPCWTDPCRVYSPGATYRTALEVNQGAFERWGISVGDRIEVTPGS